MTVFEFPDDAFDKSIAPLSSHSVKREPYSLGNSVTSGPLRHHASTAKQPGKHSPGIQTSDPTSLPPSCTLHTSPNLTPGSPVLGSPTPTPSRSRPPPQSQPTPPAAPTTSLAKLSALRATTVKRPNTSEITSRNKRFKIPEPSKNPQCREEGVYVSHPATLPVASRTPPKWTIALSERETTASDFWAPLSSSHRPQSPDWYRWRSDYQPLSVRKPNPVPQGEQEQQRRLREEEDLQGNPDQLRNNGDRTDSGREEQRYAIKRDQSQDHSQEDVTAPPTSHQTALQQPSSSGNIASSPPGQLDAPQLIAVPLDKALMSRVRKVSVTTIVYELEPTGNTTAYKNTANTGDTLERIARERRDV